jgi:AraC-like DNA-binding protein
MVTVLDSRRLSVSGAPLEVRVGTGDRVSVLVRSRRLGRHVGATRALLIPVARLGLPVDAVRRAAPRVETSPVYDLVRSHLEHVTGDRLAGDPALAPLAGVTVELVRALLTTTTGAPDPSGSGALLPRLLSYVREHLREPDLDATRIAAAHAISVRQLYRLCAAGDVQLEQWVIDQRLAGARGELTDPGGRHRSIAVVAHRWGFADPSHFSRRFREAYGTSPREWRRQAGQRVPR